MIPTDSFDCVISDGPQTPTHICIGEDPDRLVIPHPLILTSACSLLLN